MSIILSIRVWKHDFNSLLAQTSKEKERPDHPSNYHSNHLLLSLNQKVGFIINDHILISS